jgi:hypothetical protein
MSGEGDIMTETTEPIAPEKARQILEATIRAELGDHWDDEETGWLVVSRHDYMARLNRGRVNIDFYVDLLGNIDIQRSEINAGQDVGRLIAWTLLILSVIIALMVARLVGWL